MMTTSKWLVLIGSWTVVACQSSSQDISQPASQSSLAPSIVQALGDTEVTTADGTVSIVTNYDGVAHPMLNANDTVDGVDPGQDSNAIPSANTPPCSTPPTLPAATANRVMLDEPGCVSTTSSCITPVKNQGSRSTCQTFATVAAIESAYLVQHGSTLDLSEQYLLNMYLEDQPTYAHAPSVGAVLKKMAPFCDQPPAYAIPQSSEWPYSTDNQYLFKATMKAVPGAPQDDSALDSDLWGPGTPQWSTMTALRADAFAVDVADYNILVFPPPAVHAQASYGPAQYVTIPKPSIDPNIESCFDNDADTAACEAAAAPFEAALAQQHAVAFCLDWASLKQNGTDGKFYHNTESAPYAGHCVLLVGYDRTNGYFRIKNSWGDNWNDNGFADLTYDAFLKAISTSGYYVSAVRSYLDGPIPNGFWRGFWQGSLDGQPGVAVVHHVYGSSFPDANEPAGEFYGPSGPQGVDFLSWSFDSTNTIATAVFAQAGTTTPWFSLAWNVANYSTINQSTWRSLTTGSEATAVWSKCDTNFPANQALSPSGSDPNQVYLSAAGDPYVLPPCNALTTWRTPPTLSCDPNTEDTLLEKIAYMDPNTHQETIRGGCLALSTNTPQCPGNDSNLWIDGGLVDPNDQSNDELTDNVHRVRDVCAPHPGSNYGCDPNTPIAAGRTACGVPTCAGAAPTVFGLQTNVFMGAAEGVVALKGKDACIKAIYAPIITCPTGFTLSGPNGNDCLASAP